MTDYSELKRLIAQGGLPPIVSTLIAENERPSSEEEEASAVVDRLAELLASVSLAVRGPYLPLQRHSYHDLPERCTSLVSERDKLKADLQIADAACFISITENKALKGKNEALRKALTDCSDSLHGEMLQKFGGQLPDDMHPVTRRDYDRDIAEVAGYRATLSKEAQT